MGTTELIDILSQVKLSLKRIN